MKILLAANSLYAFAMAAVMIFVPAFFLGEPSGDPTAAAMTNATARSLGFAALSIGGLSLLMMLRPLSAEVRFAGFGALALFHLGLGISQLLNVIEGLSPIPFVAIHAVFFLIFFATFVFSTRKS